MSNNVKLSTLGVQINFPTWQTFNLDSLTNDGVILFQYLVFHCTNTVEWTHSDSDLLYELGLKRTRLTTVRNKFKAMGILEMRIVRNQYDNKITAYRLNFAEIAKPEKLKLIYRDKDQRGEPIDLNQLSLAYKELALGQPKKAIKKAKTAVTNERQQTVIPNWVGQLGSTMERFFKNRRAEFVKARKPGEKVPVGEIKFSKSQLKKLEGAVNTLDRDYVDNAFTAFCDTLNEVTVGQKRALMPNLPKNALSYFLTYKSDSSHDDYPTIRSFAEYFATHYRRG